MDYDKQFQAVMGGYDTNDAVAHHIWDSLVQDGYGKFIEQAYRKNKLIPQLNNNWLPHDEHISRQEQDITREVMRRI